MRFADPHALWLLLVVPLLIVGLSLRYGWRKRVRARLGPSTKVRQLVASVSPVKRAFKSVFLVLGVAFVVLSLARCQACEKTTLARRVGLDVVVALDFSKSMLARDPYPSRIERAKAELERLLDELGGDRVGLVAFAGDTVSYPMTTDYTAAKLFWRDMSPLDMPVGGTAIGKAIVAGTRLLTRVRNRGNADSHGQPRAQVILLLTDGEDHESDPIAAAKEAAKQGIRIYTVAIGTRSGEPVPLMSSDGKISGYMKNDDGSFVTTRVDTDMLQKIADIGRGKFIGFDAKSFGVDPIIAALAKLKRAEGDNRLIRHFDEVYSWYLFPGFMLLLIETCLSDRRRLRAVR